MFNVNDKVNVFHNGELQSDITGQVVEVTDDRVYVRPIHKDIPEELQEVLFGEMKIPHNLDGSSIPDPETGVNENWSIKLQE